MLAFEDAVRSAIEVDELRLRVTDRLAARLPVIARTLTPRLIAAPAGSRLRVAVWSRMLIAGWAAFDRRGWGYLQRVHAPDVVFRSVPGHGRIWRHRFPSGGVLGPGWPVCCVRIANRAEGRYSGIAVESEFFFIYEVGAEGMIVRYWTTNTLPEAAGFYEQRLAEPRLR